MVAGAPSFRVTAYDPEDRAQVLDLVPRLATGVAPFRDPEKVIRAVRNSVESSLHPQVGEGRAVFVAKQGSMVVGFVTAEQRAHWSGDIDAYVRELVTASDFEGRGVGRALLETVERWAGDHGLAFVTLETGAGNERARGFYRHLGYQAEDVCLTKVL